MSEITTNEDGCKYKLFPNAYQFMLKVKEQLQNNIQINSNGVNQNNDLFANFHE